MTSSTSQEKKPILITGCSSGIGLETALFLQNSYRVIASVRNPDDINLLEKYNIECIHLDLADEASIDTAITYIKENASNIYGLVNNGAYGQPGAVEDLTRDALVEQYQTNVFGTHSLTQKLIPLFRENDAGRIIQISSVLGFIGLPMRGAYNSSKFALEGLSDTMRVELRDTNIKVIIIEPGPIESKFRPNAYKAFAKHIDEKNSVYSHLYAKVYDRLHSKKNAQFTLPPSAVAKCVLHALESKRPKIRYWVTIPTIVMGVLKRILPERLMDKFIAKNAD